VGTSTITLRVTDSRGRVATVSQDLTVAAAGGFHRITNGQSGSRSFGLSGDGAWMLYGNGNGIEDQLPDSYEDGDDEDLFLMQMATGRVRPVPGHGHAEGDISDDGRYVVFASRDRRLAPGASPHAQGTDVFVWDTATDAITRVTAGMASSSRPRISGNGRYVVFYSEDPFGVVGSDEPTEVYRWDRLTGQTLRLTHSKPGLGARHPDISDDGAVVSFQSYGMLPDDGPGIDAGVWDEATGTAERISVVGGGLYSGVSTRVSGDGSAVFFTSEDQSVGVDANGWEFDLFVWDRETRTTSRITSRPTSAGGIVAASRDGDRVTYLDVDLVTGRHRLFTHDRTTGEDTLLLDGESELVYPDISDDGGTLVIEATGEDISPGDHELSHQLYLLRPAGP
jgi:Tol biopolymer transport system component